MSHRMIDHKLHQDIIMRSYVMNNCCGLFINRTDIGIGLLLPSSTIFPGNTYVQCGCHIWFGFVEAFIFHSAWLDSHIKIFLEYLSCLHQRFLPYLIYVVQEMIPENLYWRCNTWWWCWRKYICNGQIPKIPKYGKWVARVKHKIVIYHRKYSNFSMQKS